jgi:hypothetical protein
MSTVAQPRWVVTTAVERLAPDDRGRAEITLTVTNLHDSAVPAALTISPGAGTATTWFSVIDPERVIDPGASVPFVVTVAVPPDAPSGEYVFQAEVREAGAAAAEEGVRSSRILLAVPPPVRQRRRLTRGWLLALGAGGVGLVVLIAIGAVILTQGGGPPGDPSATALPTDPRIAVPNVLGATNVEAIAATLEEAGFVPVIRYLYRADGGGSIEQNPGPLAEASPGDVVEVTFAAAVSAPANVTVEVHPRPSPVGIDHSAAAKAVDVELAWEQAEEFVTTWQVMFFRHHCYLPVYEGYVSSGVGLADTTRFQTIRIQDGPITMYGGLYFLTCFSAGDAAYIAAVDDFGNLGPLSEFVRYSL